MSPSARALGRRRKLGWEHCWARPRGQYITSTWQRPRHLGNSARIDRLDTPGLVDNLNAGENMQGHPIVCQSFEVEDGIPAVDELLNSAIVNALIGMYQVSGGGPMGQSVVRVAMRPWWTPQAFSSPRSRGGHSCRTNSNSRNMERKLCAPFFKSRMSPLDSCSDHHDRPSTENFITVMPGPNQPFSRGSGHISSTNVKDLQTWEPAYNINPLSMEPPGARCPIH